MKIKQSHDLSILLEYGFLKIDQKEEEDNENWVIANYDYLYEIGHSRRGQFYYLLVKESNREIIIYASAPDGSGGAIKAPSVLISLIKEDLIEE